ncbi:XamI family restriction endonuclease [Sorangium sp. So ce185]|uniref:XamI family restriction endonuclease n=1 Tax=Sorangium sp. So ce185 TaxID=3133287 RepID=UPI003F5E6A08
MAPAALVAPPVHTREQLKVARDLREAAFRARWRAEGADAVVAACEELRPQVEAVLRATNNLRRIDGAVFRNDPDVWQLLRYVCAPVLSEENFWTLVGSPKSKTVRSQYADDAAEVIAPVVDPVRFPWVREDREPTRMEAYAAVLSTVVLLAAQRVGTGARGDVSKRQEAAVASVLAAAGYFRDLSSARIAFIDDLPRGSYSPERRLGSAKCDVPVRLRDGRLLAIECKVSIGPKNGWKRLNRETGGKAETWRAHFGAGQVITAVVLDGVFDLGCLVQAQDRQGVTIFWEHDLDALSRFLVAVG